MTRTRAAAALLALAVAAPAYAASTITAAPVVIGSGNWWYEDVTYSCDPGQSSNKASIDVTVYEPQPPNGPRGANGGLVVTCDSAPHAVSVRLFGALVPGVGTVHVVLNNIGQGTTTVYDGAVTIV